MEEIIESLFITNQTMETCVRNNDNNESTNCQLSNISLPTNSSKCFYPESLRIVLSESVRWFLTALYCVTFLLALLCNGTVIAVQWVSYRLPPPQNIRKYLISLALSDSVYAVLCMPFMLAQFLFGDWFFPSWLCPVTQYAQLLGVFVSANTLTIIGVERYFAVFYPVSPFHRLIKHSSHLLVAGIWLLGLAFSAWSILYTQTVELTSLSSGVTYHQCSNYVGLGTVYRQCLVVAHFVVTFAIPAVVLLFTGTAIVAKSICLRNRIQGSFSRDNSTCQVEMIDFASGQMQSPDDHQSVGSTSTGNGEQTHRDKNRDKNLTKTIKSTLIAILLYVLCWAPLNLFQLIHELDLFSYCTEQEYNRLLVICIAFHWLVIASSFINTFVYTFASERFSKDLRYLPTWI